MQIYSDVVGPKAVTFITTKRPLKKNKIMTRKVLHSFPRGIVTKYHRLDGLSNRNLFSHISGGSKPEIKVLVGLVSSEASVLDC